MVELVSPNLYAGDLLVQNPLVEQWSTKGRTVKIVDLESQDIKHK